MLQLKPCDWLADLIPETTKATEEQITANMQANGFCSAYPIILYNGRIIAGRARYRACLATGTMPTTRDYAGEGQGPELFAFLDNITRLTERQRAYCAAAITKHLKTKDIISQIQPGREVCNDESRISSIAASTGVHRKFLKRIRRVLDQGCPELIDGFKRDKISIMAAEKIIKLTSHAQQAKAIRDAAELERADLAQFEAWDANKRTVPDHLVEAFLTKVPVAAKDYISKAIRQIEKLAVWNPHTKQAWINSLRSIREDIEMSRPWFLHTPCEGKGCPDCLSLGWLPKSQDRPPANPA